MLVTFVGGTEGAWQIDRCEPYIGDGLAAAARLAIHEGAAPPGAWALRGARSSARYTTRLETDALALAQPAIGRPTATRAALIPIRKSAAWWQLAQDERRAIFEETSHHIRIGSEYLPAIARRLHHSRDLGEPFDFLTWFEYAPADADAFEDMVRRLRATEEWRYVDREVDVRLSRS